MFCPFLDLHLECIKIIATFYQYCLKFIFVYFVLLFHSIFHRQALDDLKDNNKMQINLMTILADDYNSFSKEIVAVIAQQIMKVSNFETVGVLQF